MADRPPPRAATTRATFKIMVWSVVIALLMIISMAGVILTAIGMIPTIGALLLDRTPGKYSAFCIGSLNFAGVFPSIMELFTTGNSISQAMGMIGDPLNLIIMYGAAMFGWALYMFVPPIVTTVLAVTAQHRIAQLRSDQRALIQEWSPAIAVPPTKDTK